jgi:hypothetical protein
MKVFVVERGLIADFMEFGLEVFGAWTAAIM